MMNKEAIKGWAIINKMTDKITTLTPSGQWLLVFTTRQQARSFLAHESMFGNRLCRKIHTVKRVCFTDPPSKRRPRMSKHTPEPWEIEVVEGENTRCDEIWNNIVKKFICKCCSDPFDEESQANAHRIVACVNALEGFSTEDLEAGIVGEMVELSNELANNLRNDKGGSVNVPSEEALRKLEALLSKKEDV